MFYTDLETWLLDFHDEKIFIIRRKKHTFTPFEQDKKYSDEDTWEQVTDGAKIVEAIELPNRDVLLGFKDVWTEDVRDENNSLIDTKQVVSQHIDYYLLSEIELTDITGDEF